MRRLIIGMIATTLAANAMSAETVILEREATEASRYKQQVEVQYKVMKEHYGQAKRLKASAEAALRAAKKREVRLAELEQGEHKLVDNRVIIGEYKHVAYEFGSSEKQTEARIK